MTISLIQQDIVWGDPQANCKRMEKFVSSAPGAELYVLPEMFSTGFNGIAEIAGQDGETPTLKAMKTIAASRNCALAGSIAVEERGRRFNRFYFVKPDGSVAQYDKKHLFTYGGEHERFSAGDRRVIVEWKGVRFLLLVCYDLRFPVWARNLGDYDAILYVASWPMQRRAAWDALLRARAIENQCFVAGVNRVGSDPSCSYDGGTVLLNPWGKTLVACTDEMEGVVTATIDMDGLDAFRSSFPVLKDADAFSLI